MGYEYRLLPADGDDYRNRREALAARMRTLPTFLARIDANCVCLGDRQRADDAWYRVEVSFEPDHVFAVGVAPPMAAVGADLRTLARWIGDAEWLDDEEPARF